MARGTPQSPKKAMIARSSALPETDLSTLSAVDLLQPADHQRNRLFIVTRRDGRVMSLSAENARRLAAGSQTDPVGRLLSDFAPPRVAERFQERDRELENGAAPASGAQEPWLNARGRVDFTATDEFPLRDRAGRFLGALRFFQRHPSRALSPVSADARPIERAVAYIRAHIDRPLTLPTLSSHLGASPRHLQRLFKAHFDIGVKQYIIETRVDFAIEDLAATLVPIHQVARQCGFQDPSAFAYQFRKATGLTPKEFRKQNATPLG